MSGLLILAIVLMVVGVVGTVLPGLPGVTLVLGGFLLAAYDTQFTKVGWGTLAILGVLTMLTFAVEFFATMLGAKRVGASKLAMIGAGLGTFGGLLLFPIGLLIGPFVGAVAGELLHQRKHPKESIGHASKVGIGAWVGLLLGTVAKLAIVGLMIGIFLFAYFR
jgi:uncharacterized protein